MSPQPVFATLFFLESQKVCLESWPTFLLKSISAQRQHPFSSDAWPNSSKNHLNFLVRHRLFPQPHSSKFLTSLDALTSSHARLRYLSSKTLVKPLLLSQQLFLHLYQRASSGVLHHVSHFVVLFKIIQHATSLCGLESNYSMSLTVFLVQMTHLQDEIIWNSFHFLPSRCMGAASGNTLPACA